MPSLSLSQWARYEPSIPRNGELPASERFYLEVHAGMSALQFAAFIETLKSATDEASMAAALEPVLRLGKVPLTLDGAPVSSVGAYVLAISEQRGRPLLSELQERIVFLNSYAGTRELFCVRPSGTGASTVAPNNAPAEEEKTGVS